MFNREDADVVKGVNAALGMEHRTKPYDMNSPADLDEALLLAVASFRDYMRYMDALGALAEDFDESLEYYDTVTWFQMGNAPEKADGLSMECVSKLNAALSVFTEMFEREREKCVFMIRAVLTAPRAAQESVLGCVYGISPGDMDRRIGELLDMLRETEYHRQMHKNRDAFLELMKEEWADLRV